MTKRVLILHREDGAMDVFTAQPPLDFVSSLEKEEIEGYFGTYPDMRGIDQVKGKLYILGEEGSRLQMGEKTFYVRFGLSTLVFLVLFYFFSYIVHDPVPLVDEVGLSLAGSILFSLWYRKRMERGTRMVQKKIDVKGNIDRIEFRESLFLKELELYLETLEQRPLEKIGESWSRESFRATADDDTGMMAEILKAIEVRLGRKGLNRFARLMGKGKVSPGVLRNVVNDVPLAMLYHKCRESLGV
ncbi:MAG: hypothetical protein JXA95_17565 [Spirochaetales bacterium]|nr:hypothetical protein [Spirochaetales bacterium]